MPSSILPATARRLAAISEKDKKIERRIEMAKKNDVCRCIARVYRWGALRPHRCSNPVWKDGYCKTHHMKIPAVTKEEEGDERN